ncbi:MAG TPA: hypothetical protein VMA75_03365 [Candidatus Paceibacterota bacterium]|nr:hypothetical protein [Candidatus Paceibacterota bacterium]
MKDKGAKVKKADVIFRLGMHAASTNASEKGEALFALFFSRWLQGLTILADEKNEFYDLTLHLPQLILDAYEVVRTSEDPAVVWFRKLYEKERDEQMINLVELGAGDIVYQIVGVHLLKNVIRAIVQDDHLDAKMDVYFNAQRHALHLQFDKFLRLVYQRGLFTLIRAEPDREMEGKFGATVLRVGIFAGSTIFTFARPKKRGDEVNVRFMTSDNDCLALGAGIESTHASLSTGLAMIEDVIRYWPKKEKDQKAIFKGANVAPLAVQAVRARIEADMVI